MKEREREKKSKIDNRFKANVYVYTCTPSCDCMGIETEHILENNGFSVTTRLTSSRNQSRISSGHTFHLTHSQLYISCTEIASISMWNIMENFEFDYNGKFPSYIIHDSCHVLIWIQSKFLINLFSHSVRMRQQLKLQFSITSTQQKSICCCWKWNRI